MQDNLGVARRPSLVLAVLLAIACSDGTTAPEPPVIASVDVSAASSIGTIGSTRQLAATARTAAGTTVSGASFTWSSSQTSVATVDAAGLVTAVANGTTTISAVAGSVTGSTTITVQQVVASVSGVPSVDTILAAGQTKAFTAQARDTGGTIVSGAVIRWSSADAGVASIDSVTGVATAVGPGLVTISARAGTETRSGTLLVRNGTLVNGRVLLTDYGNVDDNDYLIGDYFVVWWYKGFNYAADAQQILDWLESVKADALDLGMHHPPPDARGTYLNIYIHEPGPANDNYPDGWGLGVGTDGNGLPFMSVGSNVRGDPISIRHEGFHLYQYSHTSRGYDYVDDGQWINETTATWFSVLPYLTQVDAQLGAATITANPQLALWHGWVNAPAGDPDNWNRTTRQYALSTWLQYLTTTGGAPVSVLVDGYNAGTTMLPQEYMNSRVVGLGAKFADWAAASTPDMSYLTRAQWTRALQEIATYGDATDRHEYVLQLTDAGTGGAFVSPPAALAPRGWSYNVIRVTSTQAASWHFEIDGAPAGSEGAAAIFQARLVVRTTGDVVHTIPLPNSLDGSFDLATTATPTEMYLIVAAVPQHFRGHQTYSYQVKIDRTP